MFISAFAFVAVGIFGLVGCGDGNSEPKPITETQDFAYVSTQSDDITTLNQWLRANPNKRIVSFSGVLAYRDGVSGYVFYFIAGDNSKQKFEHINRNSQTSGEHGIGSLQEWKNAHSNAQVVAISTVPSYSGGVREFTICYE